MTWPPSIVRLRIVRAGAVHCSFTLPLALLVPALIVLPFVLVLLVALLLPALLIVWIGCRGDWACRKARRPSEPRQAGPVRKALALLLYTRGMKVHYRSGAAEEFLVELR